MSLRATMTGLFWFFCVTIALFSFVVVAMATTLGFEHAAPHLAHYVANHNLPLYAHIVFAPLALVLMPFQFWKGLRNGNRALHRLVGYSYVGSVVIAALGSLFILPRFAGSPWASAGFALLALLWIYTTGRAVLHARVGRTDMHRLWMMRSAALTFAAVVLRLITIPLMSTMTLTQSYDITAWASWLIPLIFVEYRLRRRTTLAA